MDHARRHGSAGRRRRCAPDSRAGCFVKDHHRAYQEGNLDWLRLALDSLIVNPDGRIGDFAGQQFPFDDAELVAIFKRAFETIWPDETLSEPGDEPDLEFEDMSVEDWTALVDPQT